MNHAKIKLRRTGKASGRWAGNNPSRWRGRWRALRRGKRRNRLGDGRGPGRLAGGRLGQLGTIIVHIGKVRADEAKNGRSRDLALRLGQNGADDTGTRCLNIDGGLGRFNRQQHIAFGNRVADADAPLHDNERFHIFASNGTGSDRRSHVCLPTLCEGLPGSSRDLHRIGKNGHFQRFGIGDRHVGHRNTGNRRIKIIEAIFHDRG